MRILLTNSSLAARTGSELYILDVARELLRGGHQPLCYSPILGEVSEELQRSTIPVTDQLANIQVVPDVIHGQHHMETLAALLQFPGVPAIQYCHGWLPWQEAPVDFPRIRHFVTVDRVGWERLVTRHGIPQSRITILPNFFDDNRFSVSKKRPLGERPLRALVYSNAFDAKASPVRQACRRNGIALDVVGIGSKNVHSRPEVLLPDYDLVFARGRAAIEAMACGAAVICCGPDGAGPLITPENFDSLRALNFGIRTSSGPCDAAAIEAQIDLYDRDRAMAVSQRVRAEATLSGTVTRLIELYHEAIAGNPAAIPENEARAVASYLRQWSPSFRDWAEKAHQTEQLAPANQQLKNYTQRLEAELFDARSQLTDARREVEDMRNSLTWRIPQAIINWKPFAAIARPFAPEKRARKSAGDGIRRAEVRP